MMSYDKKDKQVKNVKYFYYYINTNVLNQVCKKAFMKGDYPVHITSWGKIKLVGLSNNRRTVEKLLTKTFVAESFGSTLASVYSDVKFLVSVASALRTASKAVHNLNTRRILYILKFVLQSMDVLQRGSSVASLINLLVDFYLMISEPTWKAEMLEQVCMASISMLLPAPLFEIIRRLQLFSSAKFSDDVSGFHKLVVVVIDAIKWLKQEIGKYVSIPEVVEKTCAKVFDFCESNSLHVLLAEMQEIVEEVKKKPRVMIQEIWRLRVLRLGGKIKDSNLLDWCKRSATVNGVHMEFNRVLKRVISYGNSGRVEPSCFVFEGEPGCGKSVAMNYVVDLLGKTKYAHIVRDINDGKDFYDSYNDEEVFYMDDVGQQGISQWRSIINMVSEVKFPLDCASADLKDTKFFSSDIILATTNCFMNLHGLTKQDGISNIEALWRRAHVFDFRDIKFVNGRYDGTVRLRSRDPHSSQTDGRFINDVHPHLRVAFAKMHPDKSFNYRKITVSRDDPESKLKLGEWMSSIITIMELIQKQNRNLNETSTHDKNVVGSKLSAIYSFNQNMVPKRVPVIENSEFVDTYSPEGDTFIVGKYGFYVSYFSFVLKNFLEETMASILEYIHDIDWMSLLLYVVVYTAILFVLVEIGFAKFSSNNNSANNFSSESELAKILAVSDPKGISTCHSKVIKHLKFVQFYSDDGCTNSIGLVSGHNILVTSHTLRDATHVSVFQDDKYSHCLLDKLRFEVIYENLIEDVAIIELPRNLATVFPNISHFLKHANTGKELLNLITPAGCVAIGTPLAGCLKTAGVVYTTNLRRGWNEHKHKIETSDCFYPFRAPGLCGSVLMDQTSIVGFHVAGNASTGIGVSKIFSEETILDINRVFEADKQFFIGSMSDKIIPSSSVIKLEQKSSVHVGSNSNLVPTELFGIFPVDREPANLKVYGKHTIKDVAKKSFGETTFVPSVHIEFGKKWLLDELRDFKPYVLNEKQVVFGTPLLAGLNKKSSNGFGNSQDKSEFVDFENHSFTPKLRDNLDEIVGGILDGSPPWHYFYWVEALKDELRNKEKGGVPRSFRVGTIQHQVLMKKYFGSLVEYIMENRDRNGIMVGCNPVKEWPAMYKKLTSCNVGVFAGDIAKWDGSMNNLVQDAIKEILEIKYNKCPIVSFLLEQAVRSLVIVSDDMYITTHSMPSGHYLTAILNSIVNRFYSAIWYSMCCERISKIPTVSQFNNNILDFVYGDDKVVGIKNLDGGVFNAITMREFFDFMKMGFTDSMKNPICNPFQSLDEITFLKRSFRYHFTLNRIVCPLELRTLQNSLSFYDETKDYEVVLQGKIDNYFREIYMHPNYSDLANEFVECLRKFNIFQQPFSDGYLKTLYNRAFEEGLDPSLFYWGQVSY
jgi:hypothetical protein